MHGNSLFVENYQIAEALPAADFAGGAQTGAWVDLRNVHAAMLIIHRSLAASGTSDPVFVFQQAAGRTGTAATFTPKTLHAKKGTDLGTIATFSDASGDIQSNGTYTSATGREHDLLLVVEIRPDELADGNTHVRVTHGDFGSVANYGAAIWILDMKDRRSPDMMPSVIE